MIPSESGFPEAGSGGTRAPSPFSSSLQRVFLGPNGIRAGWRLLLFLVMAAVFFVILATALRSLGRRAGLGGAFGPATLLLGEGIPFLAALLSAALMARIENRSFADYALPGQGAFGVQFWLGAAWGFLALSALLLVVSAAHGFSFGTLALGGGKLASYAVLWALAFLLVALFEEFLFRGYALYTLTTGIGFWPAVALLSAVFGAVHLRNGGETWIGGLSAGIIGLFFCFTVRRTGSLWFAVGLHAMWDYSESFVYSVPDSGVLVPGHLLNSSFHGPGWLTGGSVGPEGSALVFVIMAGLFVIFDRLHRRARFPVVSISPAVERGERP
jgi:membrane protease YdiL (CAAX protease family)